MKICVISTTVIVCPPPGYSGLEYITYWQAKGLAQKGHDVTLIAPIGSIPPDGVTLHGTTLYESEKQAYSGYWQKLGNFDVIIDSSWEKWSYILKMEGKLKTPILGVIHAPPDTMYHVPPPVPKPCIIAISKDQAELAKKQWNVDVEVAYNGIDIDFYKPGKCNKRSNNYLFLARISALKGPHIAIEASNKTRVGLDVVGDDTMTGDPDYVKFIKDRCVGSITYHGGVSRERTREFFQNNKCMLHMNQLYREPFGLAPVEAMSCGMPVIAWDNGAMRETVKHGESGFLVNNIDQVINLIKTNASNDIMHSRCREWASQFSVQNMVNRYEELAKKAVETGGW